MELCCACKGSYELMILRCMGGGQLLAGGKLTWELSRPCLLAALHSGFGGTGRASGAQGRCRDGVTHPLEGLSITTDARTLRAVTLTTLALQGKFLVLVSIAPLCHPRLITRAFATDTAVPWLL